MFIEIDNVSKIYRSGSRSVNAVRAASLDIEKNSSAAILGPSGAGKSTLLHLIGGLDQPTEGSVRIEGNDLYKMSDRDRADIRNKHIGFVFQFYYLLPEFTALENVLLPALIKKTGSKREGVKRAEELLDLVGLRERTTHKPSELSGGEAQRVAIARALMNGPSLLLCDEPTGNLDSKTSEATLDLIFDIKKRLGMVLIIVTHDERITSRTDRVIRMKDGAVL